MRPQNEKSGKIQESLRKEYDEKFAPTMKKFHEWVEKNLDKGAGYVLQVSIMDEDGHNHGMTSRCVQGMGNPDLIATIKIHDDNTGFLALAVLAENRRRHFLNTSSMPDGLMGLLAAVRSKTEREEKSEKEKKK